MFEVWALFRGDGHPRPRDYHGRENVPSVRRTDRFDRNKAKAGARGLSVFIVQYSDHTEPLPKLKPELKTCPLNGLPCAGAKCAAWRGPYYGYSLVAKAAKEMEVLP